MICTSTSTRSPMHVKYVDAFASACARLHEGCDAAAGRGHWLDELEREAEERHHGEQRGIRLRGAGVPTLDVPSAVAAYAPPPPRCPTARTWIRITYLHTVT